MTRRTVAALAAVLTLAACGGGGSGGSMDRRVQDVQNDPRVVRLDRVAVAADTLLISGVHFRYSLTAQGQTVSDRGFERVRCSGTSCTGASGTVVELYDLLNADADIAITAASLGESAGFDTGAIGGRLTQRLADQGVSATVTWDMTQWGMWGEHGAALVAAGDGPVNGSTDGIRFSGSMDGAFAAVIGTRTGSNPASTGGATWTGVAEVVRIGDFTRRQGTSRVTIADLSRPSVAVAIEAPGFARNWSGIPLAGGRYESGRQGSNYVAGDFYGPAHEETYGVFDTSAHVGAFGARRQ